MLNRITMKNLIILFTIYFAFSYIFFQLFFIVWVKVFYLSSLNSNDFSVAIKNPFVKTLINGFFVSTHQIPKLKLKVSILNNVAMAGNFKNLTLKNFSDILCTHLCTFSNTEYLTPKFITVFLQFNSDRFPNFKTNVHRKFKKICFKIVNKKKWVFKFNRHPFFFHYYAHSRYTFVYILAPTRFSIDLFKFFSISYYSNFYS